MVILRSGLRLWRLLGRELGGRARMSLELTLMFVLFFGLSAIGLPIGFAMISSGIAFLALEGRDLGLVADQIMNNLYRSFVLLAVPLFIFAADVMNNGSISDRLLKFATLLVGRIRGGLVHVDIVLSVIFSGMSGSAIADAAGPGKLMIQLMLRSGRYPARLRRRDHRGLGDDRPDHPALDPDGALRAGRQHLGRLPVPRRRDPGPLDGRLPDGGGRGDRAPARLPGRAAARAWAGRAGPARLLPCAAAAGDPARRHLLGRGDADRGRSPRRGLRPAAGDGLLPRAHAARAARGADRLGARDRGGRAGDRRRLPVQLHRLGRARADAARRLARHARHPAARLPARDQPSVPRARLLRRHAADAAW